LLAELAERGDLSIRLANRIRLVRAAAAGKADGGDETGRRLEDARRRLKQSVPPRDDL